jgi:hypothetical protein
MARSEDQSSGTFILQTVVAIVLAILVFAVVSTLAAGILYITERVLTVMRPGIIAFFALIVGSWVGMQLARVACDAVLRGYSERSVFVTFAVLVAAGLAFEFIFVPMRLEQINSYAQLITAGIAAFVPRAIEE